MAEALRQASHVGDLPRLRAILATPGLDVNAPSDSGCTALHWAANCGHTACLKALLAAGASVHSASGIFRTPLHNASEYGHTASVRALIAAGANVNIQDGYTDSPFSLALISANLRVLKILLRAGADVDTGEFQRDEDNASAWDLVDAIRADGGWANYVARHPPTTFAGVVKKATNIEIDAINLEIAGFLVPPGGF